MKEETETTEVSEDEDLYWKDYAEEKAYHTALGEMLMNAGYMEREAHDLAWTIRSLSIEEGTKETGRKRFSDLHRETVTYSEQHLPSRLSSLVRYSFAQAAPHMRHRNALVHASWVSSQPRIRLSTRDTIPKVVNLREIEDLAIGLLAAGFQFGVARTQILQWQGRMPMEEDFRAILFLDEQLQTKSKP